MGGEVEQLIKSTSSLYAKTHFKNDTGAIQKVNKFRDKHPIVTTKGNQASTLLAGILRSTEDHPVMTFDEWKILAERARADATPKKQQPMEVPVKARGDRDLFGDLLDAKKHLVSHLSNFLNDVGRKT